MPSRTRKSAAQTSLNDPELERLLYVASSGPVLPALSPIAAAANSHPPLPPEQQADLVARYQAAMGLKQRLADGDIPKNMRVEVQQKIREGDQALQYLIVSNVRLVQLIAREQATKRYPSRDRLAELLPDLLSEGNLALTEAVQKYDPSRGPYFTAYAARAIRDRVRYVLSREVPVRLSASWSRIQRIAQRTIPELADQYGRPPTTEELQQALLEKCMVWAETKLTPEQARLPKAQKREAMLAKLRKQGMLGAIENIKSVLELGRASTSLDANVGGDGETTLGAMIADQKEAPGFDDLELGELGEALKVAIAGLSDREKHIIMLRYGFIDGEAWTFERISEEYNVSSERIRQIEKGVLDKLRLGDSDGMLKSFLPSSS